MRTLVRWALKCDNAEQLGHRIRQRYERQTRRAGIGPQSTAEDRAAIERLLTDAIG
ncbi:hypothetical protein JQ543_28180 [Bradyrhizobium diazoefficiens]|nr:hypothetical protein [Bradyrhizobium diazoefficiens]MBR0851650.1 hypothetical protein [Bradyrhizobium diazoefficiens]